MSKADVLYIARILRQVPFFPENPTNQHDFPGKRFWPGWLPPEKVKHTGKSGAGAEL
jgi:hypothetical protein